MNQYPSHPYNPPDQSKILVVDQDSTSSLPSYAYGYPQQSIRTPVKTRTAQQIQSPDQMIKVQNYYQFDQNHSLKLNADTRRSSNQQFQLPPDSRLIILQNHSGYQQQPPPQQNTRLPSQRLNTQPGQPQYMQSQYSSPVVADPHAAQLQAQNYEQHIRKLMQDSEEQSRKMRMIIIENDKLTNELARFRAQNRESQASYNPEQVKIKGLVSDLEKRVHSLIIENERLNNVIIEKEQQLEQQSTKPQSVARQVDQQLQKQVETQQQLLAHYKTENARLQQQCDRLQETDRDSRTAKERDQS